MGKYKLINPVYREMVDGGEFEGNDWKFFRTQINRVGVGEREKRPSERKQKYGKKEEKRTGCHWTIQSCSSKTQYGYLTLIYGARNLVTTLNF